MWVEQIDDTVVTRDPRTHEEYPHPTDEGVHVASPRPAVPGMATKQMAITRAPPKISLTYGWSGSGTRIDWAMPKARKHCQEK